MYEGIIERIFAVPLPAAPRQAPSYPGGAPWGGQAERRQNCLLLASHLRGRIRDILAQIREAEEALVKAEVSEREENRRRADSRAAYAEQLNSGAQGYGVLFHARGSAYKRYPNVDYCRGPAQKCALLEDTLASCLLLCAQALQNADESYAELYREIFESVNSNSPDEKRT